MANLVQLPRQHRAISCAECRRLKQRCDRVFPCGSCQKRGCAAICPDGLLPSRKAIRHDISTTTVAQNTPVEPLMTRIRDLEHALATLQATYHTTPHPLLRKELRDIANAPAPPPPAPPADVSEANDAASAATNEVDQLSENLGTLSMTGYGRSRFFGPTGSGWPQLWTGQPVEEKDAINPTKGCEANDIEPSLASMHLPSEVLQLVSAFPFPAPTSIAINIADWIVANLPPSLEAWSLCETFFENGAYIFIPLRRATFIEEIFAFFYRPTQKQHADIPRGHRLAMLLMIFAIGDMLDLTKPAMPTGGKRFYYLARAAMSLEPLYEHPTLTAVQTIILMTLYLCMSDHKESNEAVYVLSGVNLKLAMMLGLHRESLKFTGTQSQGHVPRAAEEDMRRVIFHEVVHFETWQSLQLGRPSLLHFDHFDCGPPGLRPERGNALETSHMKGQAWSYTFIRKCLIPVLNFSVSVKPPPYSAVLELDAVVREHATPQHTEISIYEGEGASATDATSRAAIMLRFAAFTMKEIALLFLHRPYFASAMTDFTGDPLGSPFSKSVVTSFASACTVIAKINLLFEREPELSVRIWMFWNQLFVPCVLGTLVVRSPSCNLAPRALAELDKLCILLRSARAGVRPSRLLPHVLKISTKAHTAYDLYYSDPAVAAATNGFDVSDEVSALAGKSRGTPPSSNAPSPAAAQQPPPSGLSPVAQSQRHPTSDSTSHPPANPTFNSLPHASNPTYNSPPQADAAFNTTSNFNSSSNPVPVESAAPAAGAQPVGVDMHHAFLQENWNSFAEFEAFASMFLVEPQSQSQSQSVSQPQTQTHSQHETMPQQTSDFPPIEYPPATGIESSNEWVFNQAPDQTYPQDKETHPALVMEPTWQHFMMQMFGNSSGS